MRTVVFLIYPLFGFFYLITDWNHEKQEAYAVAKSNGEADDAGLIAYWLLAFVFWPMMLLPSYFKARYAKRRR